MRKNSGILVTLALLVVCGAAGCAPAHPEAEKPPVATVEPTPTVEPIVAPAGPTPRLSASCDDLIAPTTIDAALAADVVLRPVGFFAHSDSPVGFAVQQIGALRCVWATGDREPERGTGSSGSEFRGALLSVVPDGEVPWSAYFANYSGPESAPSPYGENAVGPNCVPSSGECYFQALVGTHWVDLALTGVGGVASFGSGILPEEQMLAESEMQAFVAPVVETIVATLEAEPVGPPIWQVPTTVAALPSECEAFVRPEQVEELSGVAPMAVGVNWDGPKVGQTFFGRANTGAERCQLSLLDSDSGIGHFDYLPGGAWAFDQLSAIWLADGSAVHTPLAGLVGDDAAITRCAVLDDTCSVDLRLGGNWVQVNVTAYAPDYIYYADGVDVRIARDNIGELAATIVANLTQASQ